MKNANGGKTSPTLLNRVANWEDNAAWITFFSQYDGVLRRWSRRFRLDDDTCEELLQRVWIELSRRMPEFRYDPGRSFRGWLWQFFHSRALDLVRQRAKANERFVEDWGVEVLRRPLIQNEIDEPDDETEGARSELLALAGQVQERVRSAVTADSWRAFELVAIEDRQLGEAARILGKTKSATFAAQKRVRQRLLAEGHRVLNDGIGPGFEPNFPDGTAAPA